MKRFVETYESRSKNDIKRKIQTDMDELGWELVSVSVCIEHGTFYAFVVYEDGENG